MHRFNLLLLFGTLISCQTQPAPASSDQPPNIVLVFADDLGYGDLSCYGHPTIHTPRLDQMAFEGIRLTSFYTAAPVCTPSRAGLLTGRYPIRFGMPGNEGPDTKGGMPDSELTLAEALKSSGYRTACFGKWHLGSVSGHFPTQHGFDEYFGILYSNDMMPPWVKTERPLHLYRDTIPTDEYPVDQTTLTERYTAEAIRFIKASNGNPFFLYLPHAMPHLPISTSAKFTGKSAGGKYGDVVETIDWSMGQILDVIKAEGLEENTLVIFTSDNGPWNQMPPRMYDTEAVEKWDAGTAGPLRGSKATTWDGGLRVPFIARWPGHIPSGQVSAQLTSTLDLYPTLLGLAGAGLPTDKPLDGQDMMTFLTGKADSPREILYYYRNRNLEAVRDKTWKLVIKPEEDQLTPRLYQMARDPYEWYDVADAHPDVVEKLKNKLESFAKETNASLYEE